MKLSKSSSSSKPLKASKPPLAVPHIERSEKQINDARKSSVPIHRSKRALPPPMMDLPAPTKVRVVPKREVAVVPPKPRRRLEIAIDLPVKAVKAIVPSDDPDQEDLETEDTDVKGQRMLPGVSKRTLRRLNSMFGQRADTIIDLLETSDTDGAASLTTRTLIQTLVDILPVTERAVRKSKGTRGVMGLNQIISQIRELLHDLQAFKDRDQVGQTIVDRFVRPGFMDMAMQMTNLMVELDNQAKNKMSSDDYSRYHTTAEHMRASLADYMRRQYEEMSKGIRSSI